MFKPLSLILIVLALIVSGASGAISWEGTTSDDWNADPANHVWYDLSAGGWLSRTPNSTDTVYVHEGNDLQIDVPGFSIGNFYPGRGVSDNTLYSNVYFYESVTIDGTITTSFEGPSAIVQDTTGTVAAQNLVLARRFDSQYTVDQGTLDLSTGNNRLFLGAYESGYETVGTFTQNGGTVKADWLRFALASGSGNKGYYTLANGTLEINDAAGSGTSGIDLSGGGGDMAIVLGSAGGTAQIIENASSPTPAFLNIAPGGSSSATFEGSGLVALTGNLTNNRSVIAKGYGSAATLDMSSFASVNNTVENTASNGWYAVDQGKLALPAITVATGSNSYNWGEASGDATIDLVNSVQLDFTNVTAGGDVELSLLATDRAEVGPQGSSFIGVWGLENIAATFDSVDLTVRYDDALASSKGLLDEDLALWAMIDGQWVELNTTLDATNHLLSASATGQDVGNVTMLAAGVVPEPFTLGLMMVGLTGLVARRRKNR